MSEVKMIENHATSKLYLEVLLSENVCRKPIESYVISKQGSTLSAVDLNNHQCKHHGRFRRDRVLSRILIGSSRPERSENLSNMHTFFHVYPCHLHYIVM